MNTPPEHDINVAPAWLAGYSGKGVTICIIDDGVDHRHPDLNDRYVSFILIYIRITKKRSSISSVDLIEKTNEIFFFCTNSNLNSVMI
jgi:subtilisin family serine protease